MHVMMSFNFQNGIESAELLCKKESDAFKSTKLKEKRSLTV